MSSVDQTVVIWLRFVTIKACPHSPVMQMLHRALITCMSTVTRFSPFSNYTYIVTSCADQERRDPDPHPPSPKNSNLLHSHDIFSETRPRDPHLPRQTQLSLGTPFRAEQFSGSALNYGKSSSSKEKFFKVNRL